MKSERDLVCPHGEICQIYKAYSSISTINEDKIIKFNKTAGFFCYALREYDKIGEQPKNKSDGRDCALIQLLNNTDALLHLSNKASL